MRCTGRRSAENAQHNNAAAQTRRRLISASQKISPVPRPVGTHTALASIAPKAAGLKRYGYTSSAIARDVGVQAFAHNERPRC
jgi:hypothetical protein